MNNGFASLYYSTSQFEIDHPGNKYNNYLALHNQNSFDGTEKSTSIIFLLNREYKRSSKNII